MPGGNQGEKTLRGRQKLREKYMAVSSSNGNHNGDAFELSRRVKCIPVCVLASFLIISCHWYSHSLIKKKSSVVSRGPLKLNKSNNISAHCSRTVLSSRTFQNGRDGLHLHCPMS